MNTAHDSLVEAWTARAIAAQSDLARAHAAPALFAPGFIAERQADLATAAARVRYWRAVAGPAGMSPAPARRWMRLSRWCRRIVRRLRDIR